MNHPSHDPADAAPASSGKALTTSPQTTRTTRHDGWTTSRQVTFLRALASSHSVAEAARAAGMSRQSAYALRARLKGEPFDLAWHAAMRCRFDALAEIAIERAMHGVEVPHFYHGELVGTSRRYDERLTIALLAMRERFDAPRFPATHRASAYNDGEFGKLVARVETGPETWLEEARAAYADLPEEEDWDEEENEDWDEEDDWEEGRKERE